MHSFSKLAVVAAATASSFASLTSAAPAGLSGFLSGSWTNAAPASSMWSSSGSSGVNHIVTVGGTKDGKPVLAYNPPVTYAKKGETVAFVFDVKNHTVTQSAFDTPCSPLQGGFDSGFKLVQADDSSVSAPSFIVTVQDEAKPIWFHCEQLALPAGPPHCRSGMVGAINPPSSGNTFDAFKAKALALGTGSSGSTSSAPPASTQSPDSGASFPLGTTSKSLSENDKAVLNLLETAENLEANLYQQGLKKFPNEADYEAAFPNGKGKAIFKLLSALGSHENDHRRLIHRTLEATGSKSLYGPNLDDNSKDFDFGPALDSVKSWVTTITQIEGGGTSGYLSALSALEDKELREVAAEIATIEARHNAILRFITKLSASPSSFDANISPNDVLTLVGGLIKEDTLKQLAFKPHITVNIKTTEPKQGSNLQFAGVKTNGQSAWCAFVSQLNPLFTSFDNAAQTCSIPTSSELGGQTYVYIVKSKDTLSEDTILAGPGIIELGPETPFAKFPQQFSNEGTVTNAPVPKTGINAAGLADGDVKVAQLLLVAENLESLIYNKGVEKFSSDEDYKKAFGYDGLLDVITLLGAQENDHRLLYQNLLKAKGVDAVLQDKDNSDKFIFGNSFDSVESFIKTIGNIEGGGTSGYLGGVGALEDKDFRTLAAKIATIEARHSTLLRFITGLDVSATPYDAVITPDDVLTLVGGLISKDLLKLLAFAPHTTLTATTTKPAQGQSLSFDKVDISGTGQAFCAFLSALAPQFAPFDGSTCTVPTSTQLGGATYVAIVKEKVFTDEAILAGPTVIELGPGTPEESFP